MIPTTAKTEQISQQLQAQKVIAVKPVTPVTSITAVADPGNTQYEFTPGHKYKALVEGRLPNGNSSVLISNKLFQMQLPENIHPGDKLELLFLTGNTRLKFALENTNHTLLPKYSATISQTGRLLDVLIQNADKTDIQSSANLTPILNNSSISKQELPALLQKAILQSGLFYESHLAKWVNGKNTLEKIQQEPQNTSNSLTNQPSTSAISTPPVSSQNLSLVQQQLMALETGQIVWRGEIWNGQHMEWSISEDEPGNRDDHTISTRWKTKLTLTFPELGKITASITLNTQDIQIKLRAHKAETIQLLKNSQALLKQNMQTTGLAVNSFELNSDD